MAFAEPLQVGGKDSIAGFEQSQLQVTESDRPHAWIVQADTDFIGPTSMSSHITVRVDRDKCQGHARCHALAPQLFELDEFGSATEKSRGPVPIELEHKAFTAQANCPEDAIVIEGSGATRV